MTIADADYYDKRFDWDWACTSCQFRHTSKGWPQAEIDETMKAGARCPACNRNLEAPVKST